MVTSGAPPVRASTAGQGTSEVEPFPNRRSGPGGLDRSAEAFGQRRGGGEAEDTSCLVGVAGELLELHRSCRYRPELGARFRSREVKDGRDDIAHGSRS